MDRLPDEIAIEILDYLEHSDAVSAQRISSRLLKLARDNSLWRYKCFEKAPSAAKTARQPHALSALTGLLGGLSLSESPADFESQSKTYRARPRISRRAQAVVDWDCSSLHEKVDWYSEYIARHAPLSKIWHADEKPGMLEVRGVAAFADDRRALGPLEDGSLAIWDIGSSHGPPRLFRELSRSAPNMLFADAFSSKTSSPMKRAFSDVTECINVSSTRDKAYVAVANILNEVDLETLQVISQQHYEWSITALSQETSIDTPISVGTTWTLNLYDPRVPLRDRSRSPEDLLRSTPADPEKSIAFIPEYVKDPAMRMRRAPLPPTFPQGDLNASILSARPVRDTRSGRRELSDFVQIEPGPLSILHQGEHDMIIAGRFPSILSFDRRYFPRWQQVIHSGARLSSLISIPHAPVHMSGGGATATIVACGEYGGRGSLELYSWPHFKRGQVVGAAGDEGDVADAGHSPLERSEPLQRSSTYESDAPFSYKNRQEASSAKLLSVATQGTRIVFSDAEGGLKGVERDGRGLARRWNINSFELNPLGAQVHGEKVVRKIVPLGPAESERGIKGDGDLLVWTGEQIGIITTRTSRPEHELVHIFDEKLTLDGEGNNEASEYARTMRRALERQADERRWMTRFRLRASGLR